MFDHALLLEPQTSLTKMAALKSCDSYATQTGSYNVFVNAM